MGWVRAQRPDLLERYEELYRRGAYAPPEERKRLARLVHVPGAPSRFRRLASEHERRAPGEIAGRASSDAEHAEAALVRQQRLF
jgi:hypothetical protein